MRYKFGARRPCGAPGPPWRATLKPHRYLRLTACRRTDVPLRPRCTIVSTNEFLSSHPSVSDPLEICRALRHDAEFAPDAPIIIVSSDHATRQQRIDALRAGAWEYLGQPLDAEHLLLKLDTFTRVKRAADRAREDGLVDQVTGLYNLRGLARRARELGAQASRLNAALACVALAPDFGDSTPGSEPADAVL